MRIRTPAAIASVLVLSLVAAACGGDDDDAATTTSSTTTEATTTTTEPDEPVVSSLTGLPADDDLLAKPVVAVKIDNVDGKSTPQIGINQADVVYEIQVEGQVTRLLSLFQSTEAEPVGPVRSARGSEIGLLEELNEPLFTWHGANGILGPQVRASSIQPRSIDDIPQLFFRERSRPAPYNSFVQGTAQIRATANEGSTGPQKPIFKFAKKGQKPSNGAAPVTSVTIRFPPAPGFSGGGEAPVTYKWDGALWRRDQKGHNHVDAAGNQVAVENVIVRFVNAVDSGTVDKAGSRVPTAEVVGQGEAWVFSQGTVTTGTWTKADNTSRTKYLDQEGKEIKLTPGRTWISMPYSTAGSSFG